MFHASGYTEVSFKALLESIAARRAIVLSEIQRSEIVNRPQAVLRLGRYDLLEGRLRLTQYTRWNIATSPPSVGKVVALKNARW